MDYTHLNEEKLNIQYQSTVLNIKDIVGNKYLILVKKLESDKANQILKEVTGT